MLFVDFVTQTRVLWPWFRGGAWGLVHGVLFQLCCMMIYWSYLAAATTDPGTVARGSAAEGDAVPPTEDPERMYKPHRKFCRTCECIKPSRAHHCKTCNRCVMKMGAWAGGVACAAGWSRGRNASPSLSPTRTLTSASRTPPPPPPSADHHCPWVNNCVGAANMKHFILFLLWTFLGSSYAAALALWRGTQCFRGQWDCQRLATADVVLMGASTVLAIFFSIFVVTMMCDQWEGAVTNTTQIESMKMWKEESRGIVQGLEDVFGEPPSLSWLLPTPLKKRYAWSPLDNPDEWDKRDPHIIRHFQELRDKFERSEMPKALPPPAGALLIPQLRARYLELTQGGGGGKQQPQASPTGSPSEGGGGEGGEGGGGGGQNAEGGALVKGGGARRRRLAQ